MNYLKFGTAVLVQRVAIPSCPSCNRRERCQLDCLCCGTGRFHECDACGTELIGGYHDGRAFLLTSQPRVANLIICRECLGMTIADELPEPAVSEPDYHIPSNLRSAS